MFEHTNDVVGSKMAREMLCFTIETAVVGRKGRICETAVADLARAVLVPRSFGSALSRWLSLRSGRHCVECYWGMQLQIARRLILVGSRWSWVASGGAVLLGKATADC